MRFRWEFVAAGVALLLAVGLVFSDAGKGAMGGGWADEHVAAAATPAAPVDPGPFGVPEITATELAHGLMAGDPELVVIDAREGDEMPADRIPMAYWMPPSDPAWGEETLPFAEHRRLVLVTDEGTDEQAGAAWRPVAALGYERAVVLAGGMTEWTRRYVDVLEPHEAASAEAWNDYRARQAVALYLGGGVDALNAGSAAAGGSRPAVAPPPLPVRTVAAVPTAAVGCCAPAGGPRSPNPTWPSSSRSIRAVTSHAPTSSPPTTRTPIATRTRKAPRSTIESGQISHSPPTTPPRRASPPPIPAAWNPTSPPMP